MRRLKIFACVAVIFLGGMGSGAAVSGYFLYRQVKSISEEPGKATDLILLRLRYELSLTPEQQARVKEDVAKLETLIFKVEGPCRTERRAEVDKAIDEFNQALNPQQQRRYAELVSELRSKRANWDRFIESRTTHESSP